MKPMGSLFSGGGGWEEGAKMIGYDPLWGVELDPIKGAVWQTNNPHGQLHAVSVEDLDPRGLPPVAFMATSPPCQGFSLARKKSLDERCDLFVGLRTVDFAHALHPAAIMLEESAEYLWDKKGEPARIYETIIHGLYHLGYRHEQRILDARNYGLPSRRTRLYGVFLSREASFAWPSPSSTQADWWTAIEDLVPQLPDAGPLAPWQLRGLEAAPPARWPVLVMGGNWLKEVRGVKIAHADASRPSPAMVSSFRSMSGTRILFESGEAKRFTPRCAARLLAFPDSYELPEEPETAFAVIGNAVSPLMSAQLLGGLQID